MLFMRIFSGKQWWPCIKPHFSNLLLPATSPQQKEQFHYHVNLRWFLCSKSSKTVKPSVPTRAYKVLHKIVFPCVSLHFPQVSPSFTLFQPNVSSCNSRNPSSLILARANAWNDPSPYFHTVIPLISFSLGSNVTCSEKKQWSYWWHKNKVLSPTFRSLICFIFLPVTYIHVNLLYMCVYWWSLPIRL